jgi:hypothetical protein
MGTPQQKETLSRRFSSQKWEKNSAESSRNWRAKSIGEQKKIDATSNWR